MTLRSHLLARITRLAGIQRSLVAFLTIALLAGTLCAESSRTQALLVAMGANAKQMTPYQWKQRITVMRRGIPAATIIEELHFDAAGQLQRITLAKPEERRMGPIRARKTAEVKDSVQDVMSLAGRYSHPQQVSQAIRSGEIWEGQGTLRVQARSVIVPGDEMTIVVNGATYLATRIDCRTQYEGSPVSILADYQPLPNGPAMMTRMTVQIPKEDITVSVEAFDFVRLANPGVPSF